MIRMIVTDLDGTILRKDKTVSDDTLSALRRCRENGIKIVLATARPVRTVKPLAALLENDACICHNGAITMMGEAVFQEVGISSATTKALLDKAGQFGDMKVSIEIDDKLYANFEASTVWPGEEAVWTDFGDLPQRPANKIIFMTAKRDEICAIEQLMDDSLYGTVADNIILMVMNKKARKRNAVYDVAKHFGIALSEIAAFGDDFNDIEMLRDCGKGVAVANAIEEAKMVADFVYPSNEEDGVAKWIEQYIL